MKRLVACFLCALAFQATAAAHVLDEYVQAAQISLAPGGVRVELRLVPGVELANRVFRMIDVDGDRDISPTEEQAYARRVLQDIALEVDGRRAPLALTGVGFPSRREMNEGIGAIRLDLTAEAALGATGEHHLSFRNGHLPELSVYLANALVPATDVIKITGQQRDALQHGLQVDFRVLSADARGRARGMGVLLFGICVTLLLTQWKRLHSFLRRLEDKRINERKHFPECQYVRINNWSSSGKDQTGLPRPSEGSQSRGT
jgi:hypothetical protein